MGAETEPGGKAKGVNLDVDLESPSLDAAVWSWAGHFPF